MACLRLDDQVLPSPFYGNNEPDTERLARHRYAARCQRLDDVFPRGNSGLLEQVPEGSRGNWRLVLVHSAPQYVGLAITGAGAALVWPRFLVLVTLVLMIFMYALLAEWEEQLCISRFGADYRDYQRRTGRFLPKRISERLQRLMPASGAVRAVLLPFLVLCLIAIAVIIGFQLRNWSLGRIAAVYDDRTAVISTALLADEDLKKTYQIARSDPRIQALLEQTRQMRFIVYVVPKEWFLPDLPLDKENSPGGHHAPSEFDRLRYKVLFTRARFHGSPPSGVDIVKASYGRDPLVVAVVDVGEGVVTEIRIPPSQVKWGDISTPMF